MNVSIELKNGFLISLGIGILFLLMEVLGLSDLYYLRFLNIFIMIYGLDKTIKQNLAKGKNGYIDNLISSAITGVIGVFLAVAGLILYINFKGGSEYLSHLSDAFMFVGEPSMAEYGFGLFVEGIASVVILAFIYMQYLKMKNDVFKHKI